MTSLAPPSILENGDWTRIRFARQSYVSAGIYTTHLCLIGGHCQRSVLIVTFFGNLKEVSLSRLKGNLKTLFYTWGHAKLLLKSERRSA